MTIDATDLRFHIAKFFVLFVTVLACLGVSGPASAEPMTVRVALILVDFPTSIPQPDVASWQRDDAARVDAYYAEQSFGQFLTQIDVFGVYHVDLDHTATDRDIRHAAQAAALADGVDLTPYGFIGEYCRCVYVSPTTDTVRGGESSGLGVFIALLDDRVRNAHDGILAHELGHYLLGWSEHSSYVCDSGPTEGACRVYLYGDSLSVMGHLLRGHVGAPFKAAEGWLTPQTITTSGDYWLTPYETGDGVTALRVLVGGSKNVLPQAFWIEYRQPIGFDVGLGLPFVDQANLFNGVVIHWEETFTQEVYLLAMNPNTGGSSGTSTTVDRPALIVGQTWCRGGKFSITTVSADTTGALVRIKYGHCR
jgi:hypothetical protein